MSHHFLVPNQRWLFCRDIQSQVRESRSRGINPMDILMIENPEKSRSREQKSPGYPKIENSRDIPKKENPDPGTKNPRDIPKIKIPKNPDHGTKNPRYIPKIKNLGKIPIPGILRKCKRKNPRIPGTLKSRSGFPGFRIRKNPIPKSTLVLKFLTFEHLCKQKNLGNYCVKA